MTEASATVRSQARTIAGVVVVFIFSLALLVFGGQEKSVVLIGTGTVVSLCCIAWLWRADPNGTLGIHLPIAVGVVIITVGLYGNTDPLVLAGFLLMGAHGIWRSRSKFKRIIARLRERRSE